MEMDAVIPEECVDTDNRNVAYWEWNGNRKSKQVVSRLLLFQNFHEILIAVFVLTLLNFKNAQSRF